MQSARSAIIQFDGASRGNPGRGASACVLFFCVGAAGAARVEHARAFMHHGRVTNNEAEYMGCIGGLRLALAHGLEKGILRIEGDSKLVIEHLFGSYKCRAPNLMKYYHQALELIKRFAHVEGVWIPREKNTLADSLCNVALNKRVSLRESMFAVTAFDVSEHLKSKFPGFDIVVETKN